MKTSLRIKSFLFMLALLPGLISCGDDDASPSKQNTIKMDGETFKIHTVTLVGISSDGDGHAAINFIQTDGSVTKTLAINFEYSGGGAVSGTYSYPENNTDKALNDWLTHYTVFDQSTNEDTHLEKGTVTVKDNGGSNYTVTMDLLMDDGTVFKGKYQGKFFAQFSDQ